MEALLKPVSALLKMSTSMAVQGKYEVACYNLCRIFLMDDANYPCWIVLVPQINEVKVRQSHHHRSCEYVFYCTT